MQWYLCKQVGCQVVIIHDALHGPTQPYIFCFRYDTHDWAKAYMATGNKFEAKSRLPITSAHTTKLVLYISTIATNLDHLNLFFASTKSHTFFFLMQRKFQIHILKRKFEGFLGNPATKLYILALDLNSKPKNSLTEHIIKR